MINTNPGSMILTCLVKRLTNESRNAKKMPTSVPPRLTTKNDTEKQNQTQLKQQKYNGLNQSYYMASKSEKTLEDTLKIFLKCTLIAFEHLVCECSILQKKQGYFLLSLTILGLFKTHRFLSTIFFPRSVNKCFSKSLLQNMPKSLLKY